MCAEKTWQKSERAFERGQEPDASRRLVALLYRAVFRRQADNDGLQHWSNRLNGGMSLEELVGEFLSSVEFDQGNANLYVRAGSPYSPIVDPAQAAEFLKGAHARTIPRTLNGIPIDHVDILQTWHNLLPYMLSAPFHETNVSSGLRYRFENPAYSWADGSVLHAIIRHYCPNRIVEIGSGWSSACIVDTVSLYLKGPCALNFVDPNPALVSALLGPQFSSCIIAKCVQDVPHDIFEELRSGDILFIDSTHVLRTGSDVCHELFEILPRLASGVLVHFHDMFWPFEYPYHWVVSENRSWNEVYAVRAFLMQNPNWKVIFFNDYLAKLEPDLISRTYPPFLKNTGGALWLQRL